MRFAVHAGGDEQLTTGYALGSSATRLLCPFPSAVPDSVHARAPVRAPVCLCVHVCSAVQCHVRYVRESPYFYQAGWQDPPYFYRGWATLQSESCFKGLTAPESLPFEHQARDSFGQILEMFWDALRRSAKRARG